MKVKTRYLQMFARPERVVPPPREGLAVVHAKSLTVASVIGLIGADFHFLSDCIAGSFLGASTGWIVVMLWESGGRRPVSPQRRTRG